MTCNRTKDTYPTPECQADAERHKARDTVELLTAVRTFSATTDGLDRILERIRQGGELDE